MFRENLNRDDIEIKIQNYLANFSWQKNLKGFTYIKELLAICLNNENILPLNRIGYNIISQKYKKSVASIEKNIANFIENLWLYGDLEKLYRVFGSTINEEKGYPTNKQFLFTILEKIN